MCESHASLWITRGSTGLINNTSMSTYYMVHCKQLGEVALWQTSEEADHSHTESEASISLMFHSCMLLRAVCPGLPQPSS